MPLRSPAAADTPADTAGTPADTAPGACPPAERRNSPPPAGRRSRPPYWACPPSWRHTVPGYPRSPAAPPGHMPSDRTRIPDRFPDHRRRAQRPVPWPHPACPRRQSPARPGLPRLHTGPGIPAKACPSPDRMSLRSIWGLPRRRTGSGIPAKGRPSPDRTSLRSIWGPPRRRTWPGIPAKACPFPDRMSLRSIWGPPRRRPAPDIPAKGWGLPGWEGLASGRRFAEIRSLRGRYCSGPR